MTQTGSTVPASDSARGSRWLVPVLIVGVVAAAGYLIGVAGGPRDRASTASPREVGPAAVLEGGSELAVVEEEPSPEPSAPSEPSAPRPPADSPRPPAGSEEEAVLAPRILVVPAGTKIDLALAGGVSSQTATVGQAVTAALAAPLSVDGRTAVPAGAVVTGRVTEVSALRRVGGRAHLALAFDAIEVDGRQVPIEAYWARSGRSETGKDAATIAAGAVLGTVLGNQAKKNDRGKIVGGVVGAGIGTAIAASTHGDAVTLGPGAGLELTLRGDVEVTVAR